MVQTLTLIASISFVLPEWLHSSSHSLQEEPYEVHGPAVEALCLVRSCHRGETMSLLKDKLKTARE